jgi:hypothetical protein
VIVHHQLALHGFWLLVWFLKSLKFFEKKFERIWFEFEKKSCFKRSLKKKRKKRKQTLLTFRPSQACRPTKPSRSGPPNRPPFLFFSADADTWAPPVSLTLSPSFLLPHLAAQPTRRRRANPAAPRHFPSFPPHQTGQLRQLTPPSINWSCYLPLAPSRDGRDHQWQAPPLGVRPPPLAFLPLALFKLVFKLLPSPLPS